MLTLRDFTIRGSFRKLGIRNLLWSWDFLLASVVAGVGSYFYTDHLRHVGDHIGVAGDYLAISGALFGVVIAGFAIVAALVDEKYANVLSRARVAPYDVMVHFLIEGVLLVAALVSAIAYRAVATPIHGTNATAEAVLFGVTTWLFLWSLFGALQLMRLVLSVAVTSIGVVPGDSSAEEPRSA
jgi:hypothetical protein